MAIEFLYFDLGQVLLRFCRQRQYRQMAEVAGISPDAVRDAIMTSGLHDVFERGEVDSDGFFRRFCQATGASCDLDPLWRAGSDIFWANYSIIPLIVGLQSSGHRLGILSNTSSAHWQWICQHEFGFVPEYFEECVLSYEVGAMKPNETIYATAAAKAGVEPEQLFFVDDLDENVQGAREFGIDAVLYTTTSALVDELRRRGLRFNY